jgi:hypothetical protein
VSNGDGGTRRTASGFEAVVLGAEVGARAAGGAGGFDEGTAEGGVARAGLATLALAGALVLARAQPGPRREFVAIIHTDGEIMDVDQVKLEGDDNFEVRDGGQELAVHFETFGHADTIQWKVRGGDHIAFNLRVDGHPIRPVNIYLGHEGYHPAGPFFRVQR